MPIEIKNLLSLEELLLKNCINIRIKDNIFDTQISLKLLDLSGCKI